MSDERHDAIIRHLDGTPNKDLRGLVRKWREESKHTEVFEPQAATVLELVYKNVAEQLEDVINMGDEQCGAKGPNGFVCTRSGGDHTRHVAYQESDGQLYHVSWFACNPIGEPVDDDD